MNPRLKMSHEGAARARHFQPRVIIFVCVHPPRRWEERCVLRSHSWVLEKRVNDVNGACRRAGRIQVPPLSRDSDQTPPSALPGSCRRDLQWSCECVVNRQQIDHENSISGYTFSEPVTGWKPVNWLTGFLLNMPSCGRHLVQLWYFVGCGILCYDV